MGVWLFGLVVGVVWDMPDEYWLFGFVFGVLYVIARSKP